MTTVLLKATRIQCVRQQKIVFSDISFDLNAGDILLVEGPNGSGKSSLLRMLTGLSSPTTGDIQWQNKSIYREHDCYKNQLHYVGHANGIKLGLTVTENVNLMAHLLGNTPNVDVNDILKSLQLHAHQKQIARHLSAGQKRRLALLKVFLVPKKIWILDEPLTFLDTNTQAFFLEHIQIHLQQGGIAILSSHHPISIAHAHTLRLAC